MHTPTHKVTHWSTLIYHPNLIDALCDTPAYWVWQQRSYSYPQHHGHTEAGRFILFYFFSFLLHKLAQKQTLPLSFVTFEQKKGEIEMNMAAVVSVRSLLMICTQVC